MARPKTFKSSSIAVPATGAGQALRVSERSPLSLSVAGSFTGSLQFEYSPIRQGDKWFALGGSLEAAGRRTLAAGKAARIRISVLSGSGTGAKAFALHDLSLAPADYEQEFEEDTLEALASDGNGAHKMLDGQQANICIGGTFAATLQVQVSVSDTDDDDWHNYGDALTAPGIVVIPRGLAERVRIVTSGYASGTPEAEISSGFSQEAVEGDISASDFISTSGGLTSFVFRPIGPTDGLNVFGSFRAVEQAMLAIDGPKRLTLDLRGFGFSAGGNILNYTLEDDGNGPYDLRNVELSAIHQTGANGSFTSMGIGEGVKIINLWRIAPESAILELINLSDTNTPIDLSLYTANPFVNSIALGGKGDFPRLRVDQASSAPLIDAPAGSSHSIVARGNSQVGGTAGGSGFLSPSPAPVVNVDGSLSVIGTGGHPAFTENWLSGSGSVDYFYPDEFPDGTEPLNQPNFTGTLTRSRVPLVTDGITYAQNTTSPNDSRIGDFETALKRARQMNTPRLYFDDTEAPVFSLTFPNPSTACEIPKGAEVNATVSFVADRGDGKGEIQGADFAAAGFEIGDYIVCRDSALNGNTQDSIQVFQIFDLPANAMGLDSFLGSALVDEASVSSRVTECWDFTGVELVNARVTSDVRQDVVAKDGAVCIGLNHLSNGSGGPPFNWYKEGTEPFALLPNDGFDIIAIGFNDAGNVSIMSQAAGLGPFFGFGVDAFAFLAIGSNSSGFGASNGETLPPRVSVNPVIQFPDLIHNGGIDFLFAGGGKIPGNCLEGQAEIVWKIQDASIDSQWAPDDQPNFTNIYDTFGFPKYGHYVPTGHAKNRQVQGRLHTGNNLTFYPAGALGPFPEVQTDGSWLTDGFGDIAGFMGVRFTGSASNDGVYPTAFLLSPTRLVFAPVGAFGFPASNDFTSEGPVACDAQVAIYPGMTVYDLVDGGTYLIETAFNRVGESINFKSGTAPLATGVTLAGLPAGQSPTGAQEDIEGASTYRMPAGTTAASLESTGLEWLAMSDMGQNLAPMFVWRPGGTNLKANEYLTIREATEAAQRQAGFKIVCIDSRDAGGNAQWTDDGNGAFDFTDCELCGQEDVSLVDIQNGVTTTGLRTIGGDIELNNYNTTTAFISDLAPGDQLAFGAPSARFGQFPTWRQQAGASYFIDQSAEIGVPGYRIGGQIIAATPGDDTVPAINLGPLVFALLVATFDGANIGDYMCQGVNNIAWRPINGAAQFGHRQLLTNGAILQTTPESRSPMSIRPAPNYLPPQNAPLTVFGPPDFAATFEWNGIGHFKAVGGNIAQTFPRISGAGNPFEFQSRTEGMRIGVANLDGADSDVIVSGAAGGPESGTPSTGTITAVAGSLLADTDTFQIDDGKGAVVTYEFDSDASVTETPTLRAVNYTGGDSAATVAASILAAINGTPGFYVNALDVAGSVVNLEHSLPGSQGDAAITESVADAGFLVSGMSGGGGAETVNGAASYACKPGTVTMFTSDGRSNFLVTSVGYLPSSAYTPSNVTPDRSFDADGVVALTNNVTAGGTNDQVDDWTDLTTYSNDAAAIRNAAHQLARKVDQLQAQNAELADALGTVIADLQARGILG